MSGSEWTPTSESLPPEHKQVLIKLSCPQVAIHGFVTVARRQRQCFSDSTLNRDDWWGGIPGHWVSIQPKFDGWEVTHWMDLPPAPARDGGAA